MLKNRKAQIAATMTWLVATIIIFVLIFLFTYTTILLAGLRRVSIDTKTIDIQEKLDLTLVETSFAFVGSQNYNILPYKKIYLEGGIGCPPKLSNNFIIINYKNNNFCALKEIIQWKI